VSLQAGVALLFRDDLRHACVKHLLREQGPDLSTNLRGVLAESVTGRLVLNPHVRSLWM